MRKRVLKVQTYIGTIPTQRVVVWCDKGQKLGGHYIPSYYQPIIKTDNIVGHIKTTPSFLDSFNKNDVIHESFTGEIPLPMRNFNGFDTGGQEVAARLREHGCSFDTVAYYPMVDEPFTILSTKRGLFGYFLDSSNYYTFEGIYFDPDANCMVNYLVPLVEHPDIEAIVNQWDTGRVGHKHWNRMIEVLLQKGVDQRDADSIRSSLPFLTKDGLFPLYEPSLDAALGDAISHADGFHFSRLAGEIALDGLAVQSLAEIVRLMKKAPVKYAQPLKKLMAVLKVLPSAYLGLQYGVLAPLRDYARLPGALEAQFSGFKGDLVGTSTSTYEDFDVQTRVSLLVEQPTDTQHLFELTYLLKGGFSLDDLWEVVPLSFVVDWFVNIGNLVSSFRFNEIYSKLICQRATVSRSYERTVVIDIDGDKIPIKHRIYTREYRKGSSLPTHIFSFTWDKIEGSWRASNADEAASIILTYFL